MACAFRAFLAGVCLVALGCREWSSGREAEGLGFEALVVEGPGDFDLQDVQCVWPPDGAKCFGVVDLLVRGPSQHGALVLIGRGPYLRGLRVEEVPDAPEVVPIPFVDRWTLPLGWHRIVVHGVDSQGRIAGRPQSRWVEVVEPVSLFDSDSASGKPPR
ncbi:MAG: hypothetical protein AAF196_14495 [Planctomycetota bacterium]